VVTAVAFYTYSSRRQPDAFPKRQKPWVRAGLVIVVFAGIGIAAGAIQLFPSIEYSSQAFRFLSAERMLPATEKIPYTNLSDGLFPHSFLLLLLFDAFDLKVGVGEIWSPYFGVFPLLLAVIGVWKNWSNLWVRYLTGLAALSYLYSLGSLSFLHGILYAVVPYLWMRERPAGSCTWQASHSLSWPAMARRHFYVNRRELYRGPG
jgi:hypothetical protein